MVFRPNTGGGAIDPSGDAVGSTLTSTEATHREQRSVTILRTIGHRGRSQGSAGTLRRHAGRPVNSTRNPGALSRTSAEITRSPPAHSYRRNDGQFRRKLAVTSAQSANAPTGSV